MLRNYLKTALRNLWTNKSYGFLNLAGLAVGIACAALILLWVADELTYNQHLEKRNVLYRVLENQTYDGITSTFWATPGPFASAVKAEVPGVRNTARMSWDERVLFSRGDKAIYEKGNYVDSAFFSMFTLPFVKGKAGGAFDQVHSLVISEKMAKRFFGRADPIGKTLKVNNERDYTVTGVVRDLPANTSFEFDWLAPFTLFETRNPWLKEWGNNGIATFVELQPAAIPAAVDKQLYGFLKTKSANVDTKCFLFSVNDWRLYDKFQDGQPAGGRIRYVKLFALIAWIILLIACVNFMNLATARSEQRAREVGVRKVLGADQRMLVGQFMGESLMMSFAAVLGAVGLVYAALPGFNVLVEKKLTFNVFNPVYAGGLLAIGLVSGLIAGSYPAFYLSSFNPVTVLKGLRIRTNAGAGFVRKGLVVAQFAVSMVLMIGTAIVYQQVQHVKDRPLGYDRQNLIYLDLRGKLAAHFSAVKSDLIATGVVTNAATSNSTVLELGSNSSGVSWPGKDPSREVLITGESVSPEYVTTMGMQLRAGRDFYPNAAADSNNVIINETLAKLVGQDRAVGSILTANGTRLRIVGVIRDFSYNNMYTTGIPLILLCNPKGNSHLTIRFKPGVDLRTALAKVAAVVKTNNPGYPIEYKFVDEEFDRFFKNELLIGKLAAVFAVLAVFISCLGLFGLAAYTAERRTKEIGIRKVLGASALNLAGLLSKDFIRLVAIACLVAFPVAWWAMGKWLEEYTYRTPLHWWLFALAGGAALLIALLTVSFQAIKAAVANPVKSLRTE